MSDPGPTAALPLALSLGEPAGIGIEIAAKAWTMRDAAALPAFHVIGDPGLVASRLARLGLAVPLAVGTPEDTPSAFHTALPVVAVGSGTPDRPGELDVATAALTIGAIAEGVREIRAGRAGAIITAPIQKSNLYDAGFGFPGHTEYLGALAAELWPGEPCRPVMMLAGPDLSTVPVTVHIGYADVPKALTAELIVETGTIVAAELRRRFSIAAPRLAVAGLNPHAGEAGSMGGEDEAIVRPAVARLRALGIDAFGPLPSDTLFHGRARRGYDVVIAMYHDQALIPVKTIAFDETVNVTLGLPFVRTSPDHGTALDIAGKGVADPSSLMAALRLAGRMAAGATP
jgi:4-hydroxythreonine-4-phosphate dehydrogenase